MHHSLREFSDSFAAHLEHFEPVLAEYGYGVVFAAVAVEGAGIPAPGQSLLIAAGLLAGKHNLSIPVLCLVAWFAAVTGSSIGYALGRWVGTPLLKKIPLNARHLDRMESVISRYGFSIIVVARFVDGLRQFNGIVAGTMRMRWWRFLTATSLGAALWVSLWAGGAIVLEQDFHRIVQGVQSFRPWGWALSLALLVALVVYLFLRERPRRA